MKWVKSSTILLIGLTVSLAILAFRLYRQHNEYRVLYRSWVHLQDTLQATRDRVATLVGDAYLQYQFEGRKVFYLDKKLQSKVFAEGSAEKVFFYLDDEDCEACINSLVTDIRSLGEQVGNSRVVILSNYTDNREPTYIYHKLGKKVEVYNLSGTGTRVDSLFRRLPPSVFISDSTMVVRCLYVYKPKESEINRVVFNSYKNRLMNPKAN